MYNAAKIISFFFLPQEVGGFGNSIEKKLQKPRPKLKKNVYITCLQSACNLMQVIVFANMY